MNARGKEIKKLKRISTVCAVAEAGHFLLAVGLAAVMMSGGSLGTGLGLLYSIAVFALCGLVRGEVDGLAEELEGTEAWRK